MLAEIQKHPRYEVKAALTVDRRKKQRHRETDSSDPKRKLVDSMF
jgi:hypothetical protein